MHAVKPARGPTHVHKRCAETTYRLPSPHLTNPPSYIADIKVAVDKTTSLIGEMVFVVKANDTKLVPSSIFSCGTQGGPAVSVVPPLGVVSSVGGSCAAVGAGLAIDPAAFSPIATTATAPAGCVPRSVVVPRVAMSYGSGWFANSGRNARNANEGDSYRVGDSSLFSSYKNFFVLDLDPIAGWTNIVSASFSAANPNGADPRTTWTVHFYSANSTAITALQTPSPNNSAAGQDIYDAMTTGPVLGSTVPVSTSASPQVVDLTPGAATLLQYAGQTVAITSTMPAGGRMFLSSNGLPSNAVTLTLTGC